MNLSGKRALITGASQGFGLAVAQAYAREGASVMMCARSTAVLSDACETVRRLACDGAKIQFRTADIGKTTDVDELVKATLSDLGGLDILVANAGVYGPKGSIEAVDWDEWRQAIEINLLGTIYSCRAVVPEFKRQKHGKIIILSGGGATKPMPFLSAYAASKAAVVRFAETLSEELRDYNVDINTIAPGALNTRLLDEVLAAGPEKVGKVFYAASLEQRRTGGTSLEPGTNLCTYLGSTKSDGISGRLISALWDPWDRFAELAPQLAKSDIYTLRRIVPKDRNLDWGEPR